MTMQDSPGRIVVGVDGSPGSHAALRWAATLAPALHATIEAVTAWQYMVLPVWEFGMIPPTPDPGEPEQLAQQMLTRTLDETFPEGRPASLTAHTAQGQAASVLIDASEGATMLIIGPRGVGGFAGLLLGSVSSSVVAHAHCPVLIAHER